jgi:hypothetical protein
LASNPITGLLGNETIRSILIWQVLGQLIQPILSPAVIQLQQEVLRTTHPVALDIASSVDAVIKGHKSFDDGYADASQYGISREDFTTLVASAGAPPDLAFLTEAWRRGFIAESGLADNSTSLEQGIYESRLKNKWVEVVKKMQFRLADPSLVIEAWLRAQIEEPAARELLRKAGVDEPTGTLWYKASGRPPGPMELIELTRRGFIPEAGEGGDTLSLRQGYLETDLKNKWYDVWKRLMEYHPPPRTITALLRAGSITEADALDAYKKSGLDEKWAAAYVADAHHQRTATTRELVKSDILTLYAEAIFSREEAKAHLETLGYVGPVAEFELEAVDFRRTRALIDHAVNRVRAFYVGHKISEQHALDSLAALNVGKEQITRLLQVWRLERADNVKTLSAAEVVRLAKLGVIEEPQALAMLEQEGYSPLDAWYRLADGLGGLPVTPRPG